MTCEEKIDSGKKEFNKSVQELLELYSEEPGDPQKIRAAYIKTTGAYSSLLNTINNCISSDHTEKNLYTNGTLRKNHIVNVSNFLQSVTIYWQVADQLVDKDLVAKPVLSPHGYDTIGSFMAAFMADSDEMKTYPAELEKRGISIKAFSDPLEDPGAKAGKEKDEEKEPAEDKNDNSNDETPKPEKVDPKHRRLAVIVGGICVAVSLAVLVFNNKVSQTAQDALLILFYFGIAGLSAALIGYLVIKKKAGEPFDLSAGGGIALLVLLIFLKLKQSPTPDPSFEVTVEFTYKDQPQATSEFREFKIVASGSSFAAESRGSERFIIGPIPAVFADTPVVFRFKSDKWVFDSSKLNSLQSRLNKRYYSFPLTLNTASLKLKGYLQQNSTALTGAIIYLRDSVQIADTTTTGGFFSLDVPEQLAKQRVPVIIKKDDSYWLDSLELNLEKPVAVPLVVKRPSSPVTITSIRFLDQVIAMLETSLRQYNVYEKDKMQIGNIQSLYQGNRRLLDYLRKSANATQFNRFRLEGHLDQLKSHLEHWIAGYKSRSAGTEWPDNTGRYIVVYDSALYGFPEGITEVLRSLKDQEIRKM